METPIVIDPPFALYTVAFFALAVLSTLGVVLYRRVRVLVPHGHYGVHLVDERVVGALDPGRHWIGWRDRVRFLMGVQPFEWNDIPVCTADWNGGSVTVEYEFRFESPMQATRAFMEYEAKIVKHLCNPVLQQALRSCLGRRLTSDLFKRREEVAEQIRAEINKGLQGFMICSRFWITNTSDMSTCPGVAAEQHREFERKKQAHDLELKLAQARHEAEITLIHTRAEAEAATLMQAALTPAALETALVEKWNGKLPAGAVSLREVLELFKSRKSS